MDKIIVLVFGGLLITFINTCLILMIGRDIDDIWVKICRIERLIGNDKWKEKQN